ncbi:MAG: 30S ribosomal protein S6--L-glutamate ligase [Alphaproteobacteria bacterium]
MTDKLIVGREEWCGFPDLGLPAVKARVDSGAKTSSLHAFNIKVFERDGVHMVRFDVHPIQKTRKIVHRCEAPLVDQRAVKSSSGHETVRPVIRTQLELGAWSGEVEMTLANRDKMGYRMLLGREAMKGEMLVDPEAAFLARQIPDSEAKSLYKQTAEKKRSLKIAILATNPRLYSHRRLIEAGTARGHEMHFVNVEQCYMNINASSPAIHYRGGEVLPSFDAVIPRLRPRVTFYGCAVVRAFKSMGAFCLNEAMAISRSRDKLRSLQMLSERGIDMPITGFASSPQDTKDLIEMVGGAPLVVKLLEGTQGVGVVLAETGKAAESLINAFKSIVAKILVQQFIKEANGTDLRCFVVDGKVIGAIERTAAPGEFRANLHRGGTAQAVKLSKEERNLAVQAAKVMGLKVSGVDLIRSASGPQVLEINSSPGLEGIESGTGKDIAGMMIECIEKNIPLRGGIPQLQQDKAETV